MSCHNSLPSNRVIRWPLGLGLLAASAGSTAQSVFDLVSHDGFEACWPKAITKPQFLGLLKSAIDGTTGCMLYVAYADSGFNWQMCLTPACPGGVGGCPVTLRAGTFNGNFATGAFSGPGTTDDVSVDMYYSNDVTGGTCTLKLTNLTQTYSPSFYIQPDGNNGDYMAGLDPQALTFDTLDASSLDPTCLSQATSVSGYAQDVVRGESQLALYYTAVDKSVCPLTP
jgi:hypothetical protein